MTMPTLSIRRLLVTLGALLATLGARAHAQNLDGSSTGAIHRLMTKAGAVARVHNTITLPDYVTIGAEQPWVYYGFSQSQSQSGAIEIGFSFQHGNNIKPRRWVPYARV